MIKLLCRGIKSTSFIIAGDHSFLFSYRSLCNLVFSSLTPDEWEDFSNKNVLKAEREKNSSINLRSIIDGILMQTLSDLQAQCQAVNLAFQKRIEETVEAKTKLEKHLAQVSYSDLNNLNSFTTDYFNISREKRI